VIIKIGYTRDSQVRRGVYEDSDLVEVLGFKMLFNINTMDELAEERLQILYDDLMTKLQASPSTLHPSQHFLFKLIRERHGERLGLKKTIFLQLIETGSQKKCNLSSPQEWLMCDEPACDWLYQQAEEKARTFFDELKDFFDLVGHENLWLEAMASWPTGYSGRDNHLSITILITEMLVGMNWINAFPHPRYPMAKTPKEAFCCDYSPEECNVAVDRIESKVDDLLSQSHGILLLDTNEVAFKGNTKRYKRKAAAQLLEDRNFVRKAAMPGDEVVLFMNGALHLVFLHRPFGIAGDARTFIPLAWCWLRAFTVAVLLNILRLIRGEHPLGKHED
jgi:hypothetical protein